MRLGEAWSPGEGLERLFFCLDSDPVTVDLSGLRLTSPKFLKSSEPPYLTGRRRRLAPNLTGSGLKLLLTGTDEAGNSQENERLSYYDI